MIQQDVQRGQSFNLDASRPYIYYYSVLKPLPDSIINDLILCLKIKPHLLRALPEVWYGLAAKVAAVEKDGQTKFVTWNYVLDIFIYVWVAQLDAPNPQFAADATERFQKFKTDFSSLQKLLEIFSKMLPQLLEQIRSAYCTFPPIQYDKTCVKPLVIFREKSKTGDQQIVKMIEDLALDDERSESTDSSQLSQRSSIVKDFKEADRSKSDVRDITQNLQLSRMKKFTKQMVKMSENIFEQLLSTKIQDEQWQIARQFVVITLEINVKAEDYIKQQEKVRFIQPALQFYKKALQVWMLEKSSQSSKLVFNQFICKARQFFGPQWDDKLKIPLYTLFQQVEQIMTQEMAKIKEPIELINQIVSILRVKLAEIWEQDINTYAKSLNSQGF